MFRYVLLWCRFLCHFQCDFAPVFSPQFRRLSGSLTLVPSPFLAEIDPPSITAMGFTNVVMARARPSLV